VSKSSFLNGEVGITELVILNFGKQMILSLCDTPSVTVAATMSKQ
jgi:hypothetical protein